MPKDYENGLRLKTVIKVKLSNRKSNLPFVVFLEMGMWRGREGRERKKREGSVGRGGEEGVEYVSLCSVEETTNG